MKKIFLTYLYLSSFLYGAEISMPANYNPLVDNAKEIVVKQKKFMKVCLNPSHSQLETLNIIKTGTLCSIASLPSKEGCNDMISCYINKYHRGSMYKFGVYDTNLSDLSPVQFFRSSRNFELRGNQIKDLSYLSNLMNIEELDISRNPITDIKPLINLKNLLQLRLLETPLKDISPVAKMTQLRTFTVGDNVEDISPLKSLKNLELLYIVSKNSIDICHIKDLKKLDSLSLEGGNISNIDCLKNLSNITYLSLEKMPLKDLSVLKNFKNLEFLSLKDIPVESIDSIESLKKLKIIGLVNTNVKDISVLTKMANNGNKVSINRTQFRNNPLIRCSPKNDIDIEKGKSCFEKDGTLKSWWKRMLGI